MSWGMQILVKGEWLWIAPANGSRYEFPTEAKACEMLGICYPDQVREHKLGGEKKVRVKEIES